MAEPSYKTALIVGVGSGLSASLARLFAKHGLKVALAARRADNLKALAQETGAKSFACDSPSTIRCVSFLPTSKPPSGHRMWSIYNASYRTRGPFVDLVPDEVAQSIAVSAFGGFLVAQEAVKRMLPQHRGADHFHWRLGEREGLCAVGAVRDGQIRAARVGAEHGARIAAAGHPCRPCGRRRRHQKRAPARSA